MLYEYQCLNCKSKFEFEHSMLAPPKTECPKCKNNSLKRIITGGTGFILKGTGWFADGYSSSK